MYRFVHEFFFRKFPNASDAKRLIVQYETLLFQEKKFHLWEKFTNENIYKVFGSLCWRTSMKYFFDLNNFRYALKLRVQSQTSAYQKMQFLCIRNIFQQKELQNVTFISLFFGNSTVLCMPTSLELSPKHNHLRKWSSMSPKHLSIKKLRNILTALLKSVNYVFFEILTILCMPKILEVSTKP